MNIIKIDELRRRQPVTHGPHLHFSKSGRIIISHEAKALMKASPGLYLHFYQNESGDLWVKCDADSRHGLLIGKSIKDVYTVFCKAFTTMILNGEEKMKFRVESDDFGKFKLIKI